MDFQGKTIVITGASRGIGEAAAREFAGLGANVALLARSNEAISKIAQDIGPKAIAIACDVSDYDAVTSALAQTAEKFDGIDVVINNAGMLEPIGRMSDLAPKDWARVVDVNVNGVFNGIHASLPHMPNGGTIISIGSGAATFALEGWSHYCASKAAVHQLNACLHEEYSAQGIRALVLSPGTVATQMQRDIKKSGLNPVSEINWEDHIPAEWAAKALVWMCSAASDRFRGDVVSLREDSIRRAVGLIE